MNAAFVIASLLVGQVQPAPPVPAKEAAKHWKVPPGFKVTLFAGEPDVKQPIAFTFDDRGRLWVVECYSYPKWHKDPKEGKDRIIILEDTDGDGVFDKRTVFAENLSNLSGIELGFGGVWLCSLPNLLFIPVNHGEDKPAGPPEVKLDGWSMKCGHNVFNGLKWGPDGWLYGLNGIIAVSRVGAPGTADKERVPIDCGVWRYHPTKKKFEAYAWGTTNPWGIDWNEHGEMFITNCVIGHLWHVVQGAHFERMYGQDLNPHVYGLLKSCADHIHWGGGSWTTSRARDGKQVGTHSEAGGGHAHVGCMIYQGDNWPERYRGGVFMCNLHGSRINHDILERNGSSYVARHGKDFAFSSDPWFRGITIDYGPDGGVFVSDWSDTGECHNYKEVHVSSGRIFKITYGKTEHKKFDLSKMSDEELVKLQLHKNEWFVRHSRRILQERALSGKLDKKTRALLVKQYEEVQEAADDSIEQLRLRILWTMHVTGGLIWDAKAVWDQKGPGGMALFENHRENLQAWAVRLLMEAPKNIKANRKSLEWLALRRCTPLARLALASGLRRLAPDSVQRYDLALFLVAFQDDSLDPYLPLMLWYGIEPIASQKDHNLAGRLLLDAATPLIREYLARRLASKVDEGWWVGWMISAMCTQEKPPVFHRDVLRGIQEALKDRRSVPMPKEWKEVYPILMESPLEEVRERALALAVQFGDARAVTTMRQILSDDKSSARLRFNALQTLLLKRPADLVPTLHALLKDSTLRGPALRGLAAFDDPKTPKVILDLYANFSTEEKADAVQTLSSRAAYALALLDAMEKKQVAREDVSNYTARQLQSLNDKSVTEKLNKVWGTIRPAAADKIALMTKYRKSLTPAVLKKADRSRGRALYVKNCAACHRLFDDGGKIGPDITGSQRANLDYILENVLDPSAVVPGDYQVSIVTTNRGRTLTGLIKEQTDRAVTVQTQNELIVLPKSEIESMQKTKTSMMPDGLFDKLSLEEIRDLIGYLSSPMQVPLPGKKN